MCTGDPANKVDPSGNEAAGIYQDHDAGAVGRGEMRGEEFSERAQARAVEETPNRRGDGSRFQDPADKRNRVRVDRGNPDHKLPSQRSDHVVEQRNGKTVDGDGKPIEPTAENPRPTRTPEVHIPWKDWFNR